MYKRCSKCRQDLPLSAFRKDKTKNSGFASYCRVCQNDYKRMKRATDHRYRFSTAKAQAKYRNLIFDLDIQRYKVLVESECFYCHSNSDIGIDRIDSSEGYTVNNTVACCLYCNRMKSDQSLVDFLVRIKKIASIHTI
jgi:hypothetical protein